MNFERTFVKPTLFSFAIFSSSLPPPPLSAHSFPVYGTVVLLVTPTLYHSRLPVFLGVE